MMIIKENNKKGFTLIEVIVALAIIGILSSMVVMFVSNSGKMGTNIQKTVDETSEARIAMSYVVNLLHQNDVSNAISVKADGKLEIKHGASLTDVTQIYYDSATKNLMESINGSTSSIAKISDFQVEYNKIENGNATAEIKISVTYLEPSNNSLKTISQIVTLKSVNYTVGG